MIVYNRVGIIKIYAQVQSGDVSIQLRCFFLRLRVKILC
jgi:hypothetical protein